jgi:PPOX class probable FMN-dependent enzyme
LQTIKSIDQLETLYGAAIPAATEKVQAAITPAYRAWIEASRFLILATVGSSGVDSSPRGDRGPVVEIMDVKTLLLPDWRGNNRLDSLRNIVEDGRVSLLFMVPGCKNVVRVNGTAVVSVERSLLQRFRRENNYPRTVVVVSVVEVYYQCAKAFMRSGLWHSGDESDAVPTAGEFRREVEAQFDVAAYDQGYDAYAQPRLW